jgi:hypothetical protein
VVVYDSLDEVTWVSVAAMMLSFVEWVCPADAAGMDTASTPAAIATHSIDCSFFINTS